jgi:tetratricopeptide (TPR) repeat protein
VPTKAQAAPQNRQKALPPGVCALLLAFLQLAGTTLWAQFQVGLVMPFENRTADANLDWIGESIAETLTSDLASPRLLMIGRRERAAGFDDLGMPSSGILSNATLYKVADRLDANQVVLGQYDYKDEQFTITARVLDMQGPHLSRTFSESGQLERLLDLQGGLAWQLQLYLRPGYPLSKEEYLAVRKAPRLDAFENYLRGLLAKDKLQQIRFFRNAQRLDPDFAKPAFALGMIYFEDRDYPTSVLWLSKLGRSEPDYLEANYFLGLAYLFQEKYEQAAVVFRVVEQKLPLNEVYNNLGIAMARQERPGALQYFEKAAQSEPGDPDYQFNLGFALWKRGNLTEAGQHIRAALELSADRERPVWRALYVECLRKSGEVEEANRQARLLPESLAAGKLKFENLEQPKDDYDGASFRQLRRLAQLQEELKHSKLTTREHADLHFREALEYLKDQMERQAVDELELVMEFDPQDARTYRELAGIHLHAGRLEEAARLASRSLEWDENAEGHLLLARIYWAQGQSEQAQAALNDALLLDPSNSAAASMQEEWNAQVSSP